MTANRPARFRGRFFFLWLWFSCGATQAVAGQETAAQHLARGDYAGAVAIYRTQAETGSAVAQNNLGVLLLRGQGVEEDPVEARKWFERAAAQGLPGALYNMGMLHLRGYGTPVDRVVAADWLQQAAEKGDPEAQFYLGTLYFRGTGPGSNPALAAHWFEQAALQGVVEAKFNLALLLLEGKGLPPDEPRAVSLLESIAGTHDEAELALAKLHLEHSDDPVRADKALALFRKLAEEGRPEAQAALGMMYVLASGIDKDEQEGRFWVSQAARQGYAPAQRQLADLYVGGIGVEKDPLEAAAWYQLAAGQGDGQARVHAETLLAQLTEEDRERSRQRVVELQATIDARR